MGAEGYLTLAKLELSECWKRPNGTPDWGRIFCSCDTPRFEVKEAVAIYPARATVFGVPAIIPQINIGASHTNLRTDCPAVNDLAECGRGRLVTLWNRGKIIIGLAIVAPGDLAQWLTGMPESKRSVGIDPGEVPIREAREAWDKITPGIWIVKEYREHPATAERCMVYETPPGCRLSEQVEWMLWT